MARNPITWESLKAHDENEIDNARLQFIAENLGVAPEDLSAVTIARIASSPFFLKEFKESVEYKMAHQEFRERMTTEQGLIKAKNVVSVLSDAEKENLLNLLQKELQSKQK